jgi:hypothetical protein
MKSKLIVVCSIILATWLLPATAKTYRWVDENGVTQYSQSPPPEGKATIIKPPPKPSTPPDATMKKLKAQLDAINKEKKGNADAKAKADGEAKNAEIKKQNCENAKKNLATLEQSPRIRMKMDDGSYKMLADEERTAQIEKAKENIKKNCN